MRIQYGFQEYEDWLVPLNPRGPFMWRPMVMRVFVWTFGWCVDHGRV